MKFSDDVMREHIEGLATSQGLVVKEHKDGWFGVYKDETILISTPDMRCLEFYLYGWRAAKKHFVTQITKLNDAAERSVGKE